MHATQTLGPWPLASLPCPALRSTLLIDQILTSGQPYRAEARTTGDAHAADSCRQRERILVHAVIIVDACPTDCPLFKVVPVWPVEAVIYVLESRNNPTVDNLLP
jgi:hypothetical protein